MILGRYEFRWPGVLPLLLTLALLSLLISLGFWQLGRADFKESLQASFSAPKSVRDFRTLLGSDRPDRYQRAVATGRFMDVPGFLLDNRTHEGRVGYHALAPFRLQGGGEWVLVNLGWVPQGRSRQDLPRLSWPKEQVQIPVLVNFPPEKTIVYGEEEPLQPGRAVVLQALRLAQFEAHLGEPLLDFVLLLRDEAPFGYLRQWKPYYGITPDKHRAYAFQWFSLAVALFLIFLTVNTRRRSTADR